jgi:hypothetical protein
MNDYDDKDYESSYSKPKPRKKSKKVSTRLLTTIQITVCSVIVLTAILLKVFGGNAYIVVKNWYLQNVGNSIVAEEKIEKIKYSVVELFPWKFDASQSSGTPSATSSQPTVSSSQSANAQSVTSTQQQDNPQKDKG